MLLLLYSITAGVVDVATSTWAAGVFAVVVVVVAFVIVVVISNLRYGTNSEMCSKSLRGDGEASLRKTPFGA